MAKFPYIHYRYTNSDGLTKVFQDIDVLGLGGSRYHFQSCIVLL